jgi:hypothetical protein
MKSLKTINIALLALLALAGIHCGPEPSYYLYPVSEENRLFFDFGAGSWWRYVNDSTGQVDSMYLNRSTTTWHYYEDENAFFESEKIELDLVSQVHINYIGASFSGEAGHFSAGVPYGYTFVSPNPLNSSYSEVQYVGYQDMVTLGGQQFSDVYEYYNPKGNILNRDSVGGRFYYKKNVGLIHWRLEGTDTSWTVTDYHIFS